jgi:hypothetical protein
MKLWIWPNHNNKANLTIKILSDYIPQYRYKGKKLSPQLKK